MTLAKHDRARSIFLLVPDLAPCGDAAPVRLLLPGLPRERFRTALGVLGGTIGAAFDELRDEGIPVHSLPVRNPFDLNGARRLRQTVAEFAPEVVHTWGPFAAGVSRLIVSRNFHGINSPRLAISGASTPGGGVWGWHVARRVRRADRTVAALRCEGERYRQRGVSSDCLTLIGPATPRTVPVVDRAAVCESLGVPKDAVLLVASGRSERGIGPKDAMVAFDMLRYDNSRLHLATFGTGPETHAFERFGRALAFDDFRFRFAEHSPERSAAVQIAAAVLITLVRGGVEEALEAMVSAKPIVGWKTPELGEIVEDGVTGFLVPTGDRAALASRTRKLLDNPEVAARMGEAGRLRAAERFSAARTIEQYARLYEELAGG